MSQTQRIADTDTITIAGGGLAGSLLAIFLARRGFNVEIFERWGDPRSDNVPAGRSINLALAERGIAALARVGLHHRVARFALPMRGRMIHSLEGQLALQPYGQTEDEVIYSVHRARLNLALIEAAEQTRRVRVHFNQQLRHFDPASGVARFFDAASERSYERAVTPLIGADGAGSPVRGAIEEHLGFQASSELLDHGYKELTIPATADGDFALAPDALHIWPRGGFMMIALPNQDRSFTATLFLGNKGDPGFEGLGDFASFHAFMTEQFADAMEHLPVLEQDFGENPVGVLGTIRCPHWHVGGNVALIGDAAHAIVPFHGQGMNCGFEDCIAMDECIAESETWEVAFARYQARRKANANAIADMALENYIEMRASVAEPGYQLRRQLALELERRHPDRFVPRYAMVMFRRLPYSEAQSRGRRNADILKQLTDGKRSVAEVDFDLASRLINEQLEPLTRQPGSFGEARPQL